MKEKNAKHHQNMTYIDLMKSIILTIALRRLDNDALDRYAGRRSTARCAHHGILDFSFDESHTLRCGLSKRLAFTKYN